MDLHEASRFHLAPLVEEDEDLLQEVQIPQVNVQAVATKMEVKRDNFAMLWNIDKIFGMLEDLIATNTAIPGIFLLLQK